ncbi:MAG TPA: hypothetical protein PLX15_02590 [Candidatus Woesearchaeota archaeon]|nr:hypothetical protein [Candidatus Woesearchaeota archaeon]
MKKSNPALKKIKKYNVKNHNSKCMILKSSAFLVIFLAIFFSLSTTVFSIGVLPALKEYNLKDYNDTDSQIKTTIYFRNNDFINYSVSLSTSGELADYAKLSKYSFESTEMSDTEIECEIYLEKATLSYGPNSLFISFLAKPLNEQDSQTEQIVAIPAVTARINVNVAYPGKYLELILSSVSTNINQRVAPNILYDNKGEETIEKLSCSATIIDDKNNKISSELKKSNILNTDSGQLSFELFGEFISGEYPLYIECNFDGEKKIFEENVKIFGQAVEVMSAKIKDGMYNVTVKNKGRNKYSIVYAKVKLFDENNNEIAIFNTVPKTLTESSTINLEGFSGIDPKELNITNGRILLELNYDNFKSQYEFSYDSFLEGFTDIQKIPKPSVWFIIFIIGVLVIAFLVVKSIAKDKDEY